MQEELIQNKQSIMSHDKNTDDKIIGLWLHGRSKNTIAAYSRDIRDFRKFIEKPLAKVTLEDLQRYADSLYHFSTGTIRRRLSSVKSLYAFGYRVNLLPVNVADPLRVPRLKDTLAERILTLSEVHRMFALEKNYRNRIILQFLYITGIRVSELVRLTWKDVQPREIGGQVTIYGKGNETRAILIPNPLWEELLGLEGASDGPIFKSRKGDGHLNRTQVHRIVKNSAKTAGLSVSPSAHWLRHAHASHALDQKAPIHLVQTTLGHANVATTGRYLHVRPNESSSTYLNL
ncbi:tyrosine-type recombinase/integrase [Virgibacillus siamensis]|uniref:tyrosine-type recombinase/integrase n=1 Tax=Virgibacillus siamensis TaxID=480071 RepID=UPI001C379EE5|nr:tyrosine-type recombinase/integrase [Virgibacillus siamensis]